LGKGPIFARHGGKGVLRESPRVKKKGGLVTGKRRGQNSKMWQKGKGFKGEKPPAADQIRGKVGLIRSSIRRVKVVKFRQRSTHCENGRKGRPVSEKQRVQGEERGTGPSKKL